MSSSSPVAAVVATLLGKPADWLPGRPRLPRTLLAPGAAALGPVLIIGSTLATWFAVDHAPGSSDFGFFVGLCSIVLMAWSFLLAVRLPLLEPLFGGLDRAYVAHRWCGVLAVAAMYLHTTFEPEDAGGVRGASPAVADTATDLAGTGQTLLYILVGISVLRWIPYRWWRWTHKLLGLPFVFACWHVWTATKPFANGSAWGLYVGAVMLIGTASWLWRVVGRDALLRGLDYEVTSVVVAGSTTELTLRPTSRALRFVAGQFAVLKLSVPGLREPHVFTIASDPADTDLCFYVRDLGDWTAALRATDVTGARAVVEGPYGKLRPFPTPDAAATATRRVVWVAGGVGITPFLAAVSTLPPADPDLRPALMYCVTDAEEATGISELRRAAAEGRIDLVVLASVEGRRFSVERLGEVLGDLTGAHVATCGPRSLTSDVVAAAQALGAGHVETESFDLRSGVGPDLSREVDRIGRDLVRRWRRPTSRATPREEVPEIS